MNLEFCLYLFWCILLYQRGRADHFKRFLSFLFTSMHRYLLNLLSGFDTMHGFKWLELFTSCCLSRVPWCCIWLLGILFSLFCFQFKVNFIFRFGLIHISSYLFLGLSLCALANFLPWLVRISLIMIKALPLYDLLLTCKDFDCAKKARTSKFNCTSRNINK